MVWAMNDSCMKRLQGPWLVMFSNYAPSPTHRYHHSFSHTVFVIFLSISQQAIGTCVCGNDENKSCCPVVFHTHLIGNTRINHVEDLIFDFSRQMYIISPSPVHILGNSNAALHTWVRSCKVNRVFRVSLWCRCQHDACANRAPCFRRPYIKAVLFFSNSLW